MLEEKIVETMDDGIRDLRPIDGALFELLVSDKEVCEEMLRTIMEDDKLQVKEVVPQRDELCRYSTKLDATCILGNGKECCVGVQLAEGEDNHVRNVLRNASNITARYVDICERIEDLIELYIICISEKDFLRGGRTIYHTKMEVEETTREVDDGQHEIFVNAEIDDKSDIAELMSCLKQTTVNNPKFPKLSEAVNRIKKQTRL
jgi:hypothetical protein